MLPEFIIHCFFIKALALTIAPFPINTPSSIFALQDTTAVSSIMVGKLYPILFNKL